MGFQQERVRREGVYLYKAWVRNQLNDRVTVLIEALAQEIARLVVGHQRQGSVILSLRTMIIQDLSEVDWDKAFLLEEVQQEEIGFLQLTQMESTVKESTAKESTDFHRLEDEMLRTKHQDHKVQDQGGTLKRHSNNGTQAHHLVAALEVLQLDFLPLGGARIIMADHLMSLQPRVRDLEAMGRLLADKEDVSTGLVSMGPG
mmetsp:Transcript_15535/g.38703  ORF Transcript_15535/g.38703 Transcript_15535/m.38703 type:complete len:202 (+) Transcript_15535:1517-2122(+)